MDKTHLDELYHLLREASNESESYAQGFPLQHYILGMARHLLGEGDYLALVQYLSFYGESYLIEPVCDAIKTTKWKYERVVEFGAGLAWLSRGIAHRCGHLPTLAIDKRPWTMTDLIADLETAACISKVLKELHKSDIIVMSDFLHCLDNPKEVMDAFSAWPMVILEYSPSNPEHRLSYNTQIKRYGARPIGMREYREMFPGRLAEIASLDPHILLLVEPKR